MHPAVCTVAYMLLAAISISLEKSLLHNFYMYMYPVYAQKI